jgi:allantoinase
MPVLAIRSRRVLTPDGLRTAMVMVEDGIVGDLCKPRKQPRSVEVIDLGDLVLMPGAVDVHVHLNEPGRTDWEGFASGTAAAAAGGVTTLADMPLNSSPVTTSLVALAHKIAAARGQLFADLIFHGGLVPGNEGEVEGLLRAGVAAFKAFLVHSGIDEFPAAGEKELRAALPLLAAAGRPLFVHAELDAAPGPPMEDPRSYAQWLASRPDAYETSAIEWLIGLVREYRADLHVVHLACAAALPMLRAARAEGLPITVETCPHYLTFAAEEIPDGDTRFKCAPPIRSAEHREALWRAIENGEIDLVASDHSPAPPPLKKVAEGDLKAAWGGIASLQLLVPALWTGLARRGGSLADLSRLLAAAPAARLGLKGRKGAIVLGADADLVAFDPAAGFTVRGGELYHRHKITPYEGRELQGVVERTWLRGHLVYDRRRGHGAPCGEMILRR